MNIIKFLPVVVMALLLSIATNAQVSADSLQVLHQQKQSLDLSAKINDYKVKLAKLENTLGSKTHEMESTATDAQRAADDNATAASRLTTDPQDKKLARQAESAGNDAKKSAKRARVAADNLADLKKDIDTLKAKIAEAEAKLAVNPVIVPAQQ